MKKSVIAVGIAFSFALGGVAQAEDENSAETAEEGETEEAGDSEASDNSEASEDSEASADSDDSSEAEASSMTAPADESMDAGGDSGHSQMIAMFNPLGLIIGSYSAEIGYALSDSMSVNVSGNYFNLDIGIVEITAYGAGIGVQHFFTGNTYHGWYVAPSLNFATIVGTSGPAETSVTAMSVRATAGYQWDWQPFSLRLGAGTEYYFQIATEGDDDVGFDGTSFAADASIGFSF